MKATKESGVILQKYVELAETLEKLPTRTDMENAGISERQIRKHCGDLTTLKEKAVKLHPELLTLGLKEVSEAKILFLDIETSPLLVYVWGLWDNNVSLNQIVEDWSVLSWSAKLLGSEELFYEDNRNSKNIRDDKELLKGMWKLLDEADIVITQNGRKFDIKKLNARFVLNGFKPPSSFKQIDTLEIAKRHFGFTSNKLEYMSEKLDAEFKKLKHKEFPGQELWNECLKGNLDAWKEMEKYNKHDVLALEGVYNKIKAWDNNVNFNSYTNSEENSCRCGSIEFIKKGFYTTPSSRYQKYQCKKCGSETRDKVNLLSKDKKRSLRVGTVR